MKVNSVNINESLFRMKTDIFGEGTPKKYTDMEPPLRSELFSADQMEQHGIILAGLHTSEYQKVPDQQLLTRLAGNEKVLLEVRNLVTEAVNAKRQITPAGEWLLDNFYLIEEHIHTGKRHLPKGYSRELPRLLKGPSTGLPRVYDIALEVISHGDGRVDPESLRRFVAAYQTITPLKLGELWAIPIMLRLALIENLRRVATLIADSRIDRDLADSWSDQMIKVAEKNPKNLILIIADMARSKPPMTTAFVSEFARRLQGQSSALALPLTWMEQHLSESGFTIEKMVQLGNQQQAADQLSFSNSINSLRFLGSTDWKEFVEMMSIVEQILHNDPGGTYSKMDFTTRDRYRHKIEKISNNCPLSEAEVAEHAVRLAQQSAATNNRDNRTAHVGYYLIDRGLPILERLVKVRFSVSGALFKISKRNNLLLFTGSIVLLTLILTASLLTKLYFDGVNGWQLGLMAILLLICTSHLAVPLVNWFATLISAPNPLPRMDYSHGIAPESRTLVVVPTMLQSLKNIEELTEGLEVRFLANRDKNLHFALLTDFLDAEKEILPEDEPLLELARQKIENLNDKYNDARQETFFLFHRSRRWNQREKMWMGYERKRGKLIELNSLLRDGLEDQFSLVTGNTEILSKVKYVITLDTDTQLPRDSARQFAGTMAHPLNRAFYDEKRQRVNEGYGILQPRVAVSLPGTNLSLYARLYGSDPGIDPYTRTVSDVYQDVFGEGSFIGKGSYDVDIYRLILNGRFPENRILSHDLLEGCYVRSGLISDVELFEEYPSDYLSDVKRRHRWIRGDWQIIRWLMPRVPDLHGKLHKNPLSGLSKWKIFDNFRRSITPVALILLLLLSWTLLPQGWFWTLSVLGIIIIPSLIISILDVLRKKDDVFPTQHVTTSIRSTARHFIQAAFTFICLPHEAYYSLDAIFRTLWRLTFSHRRLLEWNPSGRDNINNHTDIFGTYLIMWIAPVIAFASLVSLALLHPVMLAVIWPIPGVWFASPFVAWWISLPLAHPGTKLTDYQTNFLRQISRKTWAFFETFVSPEDHWLPPDNFQEHPVGVVAHRTSPTNMGLALLANLSAYDFGYISAGQLIERTSNALETMEAMEKFRGHFFNWYDTQTLKPLHPPYISSVDSGNLAGYLMVLRPGLLSIPDQKILSPRLFEAIEDTLMILVNLQDRPIHERLSKFRGELKVMITSQPSTLTDMKDCLGQLLISAGELADIFVADPGSESYWWVQALTRQCSSALEELTYLTPWIMLPSYQDKIKEFTGIDEIPTLRELSDINTKLISDISNWLSYETTTEMVEWGNDLKKSVMKACYRTNERLTTIQHIAHKSINLTHIEYDFLYDNNRHLMSVGYNVDERRRDASFYDLLASEARFSTFVAIAQGQLPQESWFSLGRLLTATGGDPILLSWSGSMFEYLMPLLVMPTYENTLLDQTYKSVVRKQIEYGRRRGIPWGISESGYNMVDVHMNYQYRAFGVPGTGLKRGLAEDLVVAPYATLLALMVEPEEACINLERLAKDNLIGKYGFFEAIDFTKSRLPRGKSSVVIQSFMAHHEGMSILSLA